MHAACLFAHSITSDLFILRKRKYEIEKFKMKIKKLNPVILD